MTQGRILYITRLEAAFLKAAIESDDNARAKRALQTLCKLYRDGSRLLPEDLHGIENTILGALARSNADEKVRRWSLSALAQLGRPAVSWDPVLAAISKHQNEPQVVSAAIAAAFRLRPGAAEKELWSRDLVSPEFLAISAMQTLPPDKLRNSMVTIDVERASATTLKLALILVGLNKAPPNLFDPNYDNRALVRELGKHEEPLVSQYSIWATAENPNLSTADLGIDPFGVDQYLTNIRSYIFRLYAAEPFWSKAQQELIERARDDDEVEARMGGAIGLRNTWFEGVEGVVRDWFDREISSDVRSYLLDHMVRQAPRSELYFQQVIEIFSSNRGNVRVREGMLAASSGGPVFREFQKIAYDEDAPGLFKETTYVTNHDNRVTFNNSTVQGQTSVATGTSQSHIAGSASLKIDLVEVDAALKAAKEDLKNSTAIDGRLRDEAIASIETAEQEPTPENLEEATNFLQRCEAALSAMDGMAAKATSLSGKIALLLHAMGFGA